MDISANMVFNISMFSFKRQNFFCKKIVCTGSSNNNDKNNTIYVIENIQIWQYNFETDELIKI